MAPTFGKAARIAGSVLVVAGLVSATAAGSRQASGHSGGHASRSGGHVSRSGGHAARSPGASPRVGAPSRAVAPRTAPAPRGTAPRGTAYRGTAPRGTANGIARYGYSYGGSTWVGDSYWGCYPWWGAGWWYGDWGWYAGWGWPGYGYGYGYGYGPWYGPYDAPYVAAVEPEEPPSGPASVETAVTPSKAEVVLDGESVGFASDYDGKWDELTVAPGPHSIAFAAKGYRTLIVDWTARPGAEYTFRDELVRGSGEERRTQEDAAPTTGRGRLRIHVEPPDAAVYLDGEYMGLAAELSRLHGALPVVVGSHRLEVVRPGYDSAQRSVDVADSTLATVELTLTATP